ncbi:hypothetical protein [Komagataeibacter oboediens]|uniref:hypothetical protein n=1 Tax=Komagataeibacter oboediens TaxID=65958 RepID=UPI0011B52E09|nr:hypothetical protein [Komagataeibacter oboediens]
MNLLGAFLSELEARYRKRDTSYTILGISFGGSTPMIWYPPYGQQVAILLSDECKQDVSRAIFQLAHECMHLLSPSGSRDATLLEEGLATSFQMEIAETYCLYPDDCSVDTLIQKENYKLALRLSEELINIDNHCIKRILTKCGKFNKINPKDITKEVPSFSLENAKLLCEKFDYS